MFGSRFKNIATADTSSYSDIADFDALKDGSDFCLRFRKMTVMRRHYGQEEEIMDRFGYYPDEDVAYTLTRRGNQLSVKFSNLIELCRKGYIDGDKVLPTYFYLRELEDNGEVLIMQLTPPKDNVAMFTIAKAKGKLRASMLFCPEGYDGDYYYSFLWESDSELPKIKRKAAVELEPFVFRSEMHQRYQNEMPIMGLQHVGRTLILDKNINGCDGYQIEPGRGYIVRAINGTTGEPQFAPKPMEIVEKSDDRILLRGYMTKARTPFGWIDHDLSDYGFEVFYQNGQVFKCRLYMYDRDTYIEYNQ